MAFHGAAALPRFHRERAFSVVESERPYSFLLHLLHCAASDERGLYGFASGPPLWSTFDAPPQRVGDDEVVEEPQADRLGGFHEAARGHQVGVAGMQ